ncbi:MAG: ribosome silencing factor [Hydrococcus sp. Prado102]|jgi:ribosome-associated protein|nr:ribosome silencing factor [Hydrococcus sp. Prado102]
MTNRNLQQDRSTQIAQNNNSEQMTQRFVETIAQAADDRKAGDLVILKVTEVSYLSDYFVIATGFSKAQVRAISDAIEDKVAKEYDRHPLRTEGKMEGSWVLHDYGDVIVHIFLPQEREFYNLEAFWGHAEQIDISLYNPVRE